MANQSEWKHPELCICAACEIEAMKDKSLDRVISDKVEENKKLLKEITELKERIGFLERGKDYVDRAEEYKARWTDYEAQIERLSKALEQHRKVFAKRS